MSNNQRRSFPAPISERPAAVVTQKNYSKNYVNYNTKYTKNNNATDCLLAMPEFTPDPWNSPVNQPYNNCYAYVFDDLRSDRTTKPQPGDILGVPSIPSEEFSCPRLQNAIHNDYPSDSYWLPPNDQGQSAAETPCACGYYKAFLALDETPGNKDYHFWRQDRSGYYSHKPGDLAATNRDGNGNLITNPLTASRRVGDFNYSTPCSFFCIRGARPNRPRRGAEQ